MFTGPTVNVHPPPLPFASVTVTLYVSEPPGCNDELNPVKSYGSVSLAMFKVAPVSTSVIMYGAVPPLIVPNTFPSASPLHSNESPVIVTTSACGSAIKVDTESTQPFTSETTT